jgi:hypothetical protein
MHYTGLEKRKTYDELLDILSRVKPVKDVPNRLATQIRDSPQISNLLNLILDTHQDKVLKYKINDMEIEKQAQVQGVSVAHARAIIPRQFSFSEYGGSNIDFETPTGKQPDVGEDTTSEFETPTVRHNEEIEDVLATLGKPPVKKLKALEASMNARKFSALAEEEILIEVASMLSQVGYDVKDAFHEINNAIKSGEIDNKDFIFNWNEIKENLRQGAREDKDVRKVIDSDIKDSLNMLIKFRAKMKIVPQLVDQFNIGAFGRSEASLRAGPASASNHAHIEGRLVDGARATSRAYLRGSSLPPPIQDQDTDPQKQKPGPKPGSKNKAKT